MNHLDIQQAREWAEEVGGLGGLMPGLMPGPRAAAKVIQSLPDHIIDAEKLREVVSKYEGNTYISEIVQDFADLLPTPPLPTLAELIGAGNDPKQYQWMQAQTWHEAGIIVWVEELREIAHIITRANGVLERKFKDVTPLQGEPKLEWPGDDDDHESEYCPVCGATLLDDGPECEHCREDSDSPHPEDVPPGEPWSVRYYGKEWLGVRADQDRIPWSIISMDALDYRDVEDSEVSLMFRLVPETP